MKTTSTNFLKLALAVLLFSNAAFIFYIFQYQKQQNAKFTELHKKLDFVIKNNSEFQSKENVCLQVFLENKETQELEPVKIDYVQKILIDSIEAPEPLEISLPTKDEPIECGLPLAVMSKAVPQAGMQSFYEYINDNLKYPKKAIKQEIEGKVTVKFVVNRHGEITDVEATNDIGGGCAEEAERVIKNSPKWNPARQRGKKVKTTMRIPIVFNLE
ncbi:energy transducer TonB [Bernardetia sp.]|uniref:energy transducer TonB n=1 Tax=Bernardetia sp. TaxID=1937974 RepID=UPI0025B9A461|nr:energy transducer TonB [Bernardetia sp.]